MRKLFDDSVLKTRDHLQDLCFWFYGSLCLCVPFMRCPNWPGISLSHHLPFHSLQQGTSLIFSTIFFIHNYSQVMFAIFMLAKPMRTLMSNNICEAWAGLYFCYRIKRLILFPNSRTLVHQILWNNLVCTEFKLGKPI